MLVLTRKRGEQIRIGTTMEITVLAIQKGRVKLGISGPAEVPIHREEVYRAMGAHVTAESEELIGDLPCSSAVS